MDDDDDVDDESKISLVDGHEAVESLLLDIRYVEDTAVEHELVIQPAVHGTTVLARSQLYTSRLHDRLACVLQMTFDHVQSAGDEDAVVAATSTGPPLSQLWRAGDATECVYTSDDPKIQQIADERNVTLALALRPELLAFALALKPCQCHPRP